MENISVVVNSGEKSLIKSFEKNGTSINVSPLLVGDAHICTDDKPVYIFERKAGTDLEASIKDGRYKEQKSRLIKCGIPRKRIVYIIEDLDTSNQTSFKAAWSAITNMQNRDGFTVFMTRNTRETAHYITSLAVSLMKHPIFEDKVEEDVPKEYVNANIKKSSVTPEEWFRHCLILIPRCSVNVADAILKVYPTRQDLVDAIENQGSKCISEIKHSASNRRIGDVLAKSICEYMAF